MELSRGERKTLLRKAKVPLKRMQYHDSVQLQWRLKILHDPKYLIPWEVWYCSSILDSFNFLVSTIVVIVIMILILTVVIMVAIVEILIVITKSRVIAGFVSQLSEAGS